VAVTQQALDERTPEVVPGAMYFRAVMQNSGLRNRTPAGKVGLHIFYR
jgi:hypothetical protein